jgi:hypothetical protein
VQTGIFYSHVTGRKTDEACSNPESLNFDYFAPTTVQLRWFAVQQQSYSLSRKARIALQVEDGGRDIVRRGRELCIGGIDFCLADTSDLPGASALWIYVLRILRIGIICIGNRGTTTGGAFFSTLNLSLRTPCGFLLGLIQSLHFFLALLKCRRHSDSPLKYEAKHCQSKRCTFA